MIDHPAPRAANARTGPFRLVGMALRDCVRNFGLLALLASIAGVATFAGLVVAEAGRFLMDFVSRPPGPDFVRVHYYLAGLFHWAGLSYALASWRRRIEAGERRIRRPRRGDLAHFGLVLAAAVPAAAAMELPPVAAAVLGHAYLAAALGLLASPMGRKAIGPAADTGAKTPWAALAIIAAGAAASECGLREVAVPILQATAEDAAPILFEMRHFAEVLVAIAMRAAAMLLMVGAIARQSATIRPNLVPEPLPPGDRQPI